MRAHPCLSHRLFSRPLSAVCVLLAAVLAGPSLAQTPQNSGQKASQAAPDKREQLTKKEHSLNQKAERIQVEDGGSRVDETRVGGQTQSITVQPKVGTLPSYEVQSNDGARAARSRSESNDTTGTRVWNFMKF